MMTENNSVIGAVIHWIGESHQPSKPDGELKKKEEDREMAWYIIERVGSNSANQSMTERMAVAVIEATTREKAKQAVLPFITVYANQYLEVTPVSRASAALKEEAEELYEIRDAWCPVCGEKSHVEVWKASNGFLLCEKHTNRGGVT